MKVLHLSTEDFRGGAGKAATRLHAELRRRDASSLDSEMIVAHKTGADSSTRRLHTEFAVSARRNLDRLALKLQENHSIAWRSAAWLPNPALDRALREAAPDLIHLHWVQNGFMPLSTLSRIGCPIVWTLHDMWPLCGTQHHEYPAEERFTERYRRGNRPAGARGLLDIDAWTWRRKRRAYRRLDQRGIPLVAVTPSEWMAERARRSKLWNGRKIVTIPNGIDTRIFKPAPKNLARSLFNLPQNKLIVLFGAMFAETDKNKGLDDLLEALRRLRFNATDIHLAVFGTGEPKDGGKLPYPATWFGRLHDEFNLAALYSAADVMVVPSHQESFGLTAAEAMACGRPVVAFKASALVEVIAHENTGYLAKPFEAASLAAGIEWILESPERLARLEENARRHILDHFRIEDVGRRHLELYRELTRSESPRCSVDGPRSEVRSP